jgi:glycosyltransferase involved in cell wall biosynthesis
VRRGTREEPIIRTAYVSTYPPRRCGIATFTSDLSAAAGNREIVALDADGQTSPYPSEVQHRIRRDERADYASVARSLRDCVDVVSIQHEYGIWGGNDGAYVLDFVRALGVPAIATLHTVLQRPTARQRAILTELVDRVDVTVVMSRSAAVLLETAYGVDARHVEIIPHGVPELPLADPEHLKAGLGVAGRDVILSFGLLGPGKGYELAIDALPAIAAARPNVTYVVVGATHPDLLRSEGEAYRRELVEQVARLGMDDHVRFVDRYVGRRELAHWLEAADVFVTPYPNLDQIVSGTLSYAMGAGRTVVSTPYAYAAELLADGRGILVEPGSPSALASAIIDVLTDDVLRCETGRRAYDHARGMVWPAVGARYNRLFGAVASASRPAVHAASLAAVNA